MKPETMQNWVRKKLRSRAGVTVEEISERFGNSNVAARSLIGDVRQKGVLIRSIKRDSGPLIYVSIDD